MTIEKIILKNLTENEKYVKATLPFLQAEYFGDLNDKTVFEIIQKYFLSYNTIPSSPELLIEIENIPGISNERYIKTKEIVEFIGKPKEPANFDWLIDNTEKFCREKAIYLAMVKSMEILEGKDKNLTTGIIPTLLNDALAISFDPDIGHDYLESFEDQFDYYHRIENRTKFDIDILNKITNGGIPEKTFSVLLAGIHVGKSLMMCHMAAGALTMGYDVLYITLEMSSEQITKRIDCNLMNIKMDDIEGLTKAEYLKKGSLLKNKTNGRLIVKEYPTSNANAMHFRSYLDELKMKKGFKPAIIFIDYINLCTSYRFKNGGSGMYEYIKSIAEELRGLAVIYKTRIVTATQVNREGFKSSDPDMANVAESFGLPATADFMLAITVDDKLKMLNQLQCIQLKNRFGDVNSNKKFFIGVDRPKMRIYDISNPTAGLVETSIKPEFVTEDGEIISNLDKFSGFKID